MQYFYYENNSQKGPVSLEELLTRITPDTEIWCQNMTAWTPAKDVPEVAAAMNQTAENPAQQQQPPVVSAPADSNSQSSQSNYQNSASNSHIGNLGGVPSDGPDPKLQNDNRTMLILSLVSVFICCNQVGGLVAAMYAIASEIYYNCGKYEEAQKKYKAAKTWLIVSVIVVAVIMIAYVGFYGAILTSAMSNIKGSRW